MHANWGARATRIRGLPNTIVEPLRPQLLGPLRQKACHTRYVAATLGAKVVICPMAQVLLFHVRAVCPAWERRPPQVVIDVQRQLSYVPQHPSRDVSAAVCPHGQGRDLQHVAENSCVLVGAPTLVQTPQLGNAYRRQRRRLQAQQPLPHCQRLSTGFIGRVPAQLLYVTLIKALLSAALEQHVQVALAGQAGRTAWPARVDPCLQYAAIVGVYVHCGLAIRALLGIELVHHCLCRLKRDTVQAAELGRFALHVRR
mmetsp:Transcript_86318/g.200726  ORF Transcript_86318/g.200726 Transcript_86318/m.200726 type:complete len:256 (+) Transcript_86318:114-881(+)